MATAWRALVAALTCVRTVDAVGVLGDHALDAADLSFDAVESLG